MKKSFVPRLLGSRSSKSGVFNRALLTLFLSSVLVQQASAQLWRSPLAGRSHVVLEKSPGRALPGELRAAVEAIQGAEAALAGNANDEAAQMIAEAKALVNEVPVDAAKASDPDFNAIFKKKRKKADTKVEGRQAEIEQEWDAMVKANYAKAKELADKARSML